MKNIILIGLSGSGKSTVGRLLARSLGRTLLDTDTMAEEQEGQSIATIFAQKGESYFRQLESELLREALACENAVIATGGGAILSAENRRLLKKSGQVFFLNRKPAEIIRTAQLQNRPLVAGDEGKLTVLYQEREKLYRATAHCTIEGKNAADVAEA
ncbi:MAG: shikimate kinase, partial [Ruthenibacterium sp.]